MPYKLEQQVIDRYRLTPDGVLNSSNWHEFGEGISHSGNFNASLLFGLPKIAQEKFDPVKMAVAIQTLYQSCHSSARRLRLDDEKYGLIQRMKDLSISHALITCVLASPDFLNEFRPVVLRQLLIELSGKGSRAKRTQKLIEDMSPAFEKAGFADPRTGLLVAQQTADLLAQTADGVFAKVLNHNDEYHPSVLFGNDIHRNLNFVEVMLDRLGTVTLSPTHFPDMVEYLTIALDHAAYLAENRTLSPELYYEKVEDLTSTLLHDTVKMACKPTYRKLKPLDDYIEDMIENEVRMSDVTVLRLVSLYEANCGHDHILAKHPDMKRVKNLDALDVIKTASREKVVPHADLLPLASRVFPDINLADSRFDRYKSRHLSASFNL